MSKQRRTRVAQARSPKGRETRRDQSPQSIWPHFWLAAVTAMMVATPMIPSDSTNEMGTGVVLSMAWFVLLLGWAITQSAADRRDIRWGSMTIAIATLLCCQLLSGIVMIWEGHPRAVVNSVWQWLTFGVAFFLVRQVVRQQAACRAVVAVMMSMAVCVSIHGFDQYLVSMPRARAIFEQDPASAMATARLTGGEGSPEWALFRSRLYSTEPFATFPLANSLAGFLSPWIVVAIAILFAAARPSQQRRTLLAATATAILVGGCWLLTKSRTAWLATGLGCALVAAVGRTHGWRPDRRLLAAGMGVIMLLVAALTVAGGLDRLVVTDTQKSFLYRIQYWQASVEMIRDYPWFGCGPGNFQQFYTSYKLPAASESIADPHNFLLEIWATSGTPALLALMGCFVGFAWQLGAGRKQAPELAAGPAQPPTESSADAIWFAYGGGFAGVLLAYPAGSVAGFVPDLAVLIWGVPIATGVLACWHTWVKGGALSPALLVCAAITLLVNLLSAGGISYPGVAMTLWLLLALALNLSAEGTRTTVLSRRAALVLLGLVAVVAVLIYLTSYRPVLRSKNSLARGQELRRVGRFAEADQAFAEAAARDRLDALPSLWLAESRHRRWLSRPSEANLTEFLVAADSMIARNRRSYVYRQHYAMWWLAAYRATGNTDYLNEAISWHRKTLEVYPNYNRGYAQLAWALHLAGQSQQAKAAAAEALELDAANPHVEHKLRRYQLQDPGPPQAGGQPAGPDGRNAEQQMQELRSS